MFRLAAAIRSHFVGLPYIEEKASSSREPLHNSIDLSRMKKIGGRVRRVEG